MEYYKDWLTEKDFPLYGFEKQGDNWVKGEIMLKYFTFDHWHVVKNDEDFGARFYTANGLKNIIKKNFGIEL